MLLLIIRVNINQSVMVIDGQRVGPAEPLTDGLNNPHEILEIFFEYYAESEGIYDAATRWSPGIATVLSRASASGLSISRHRYFLINTLK